jgi:hypothetical protein
MVKYTLYFLIIIFLIYYFINIYLQNKYKFWYHQPIFHTYDLKYYIYQPGIINHKPPKINKYINLDDIKTIKYSEKMYNSKELNEFIKLLQNNYLQEENILYHPTKENIIPYLLGNDIISIFSFYYKNNLVLENNIPILKKELIGGMTSKEVFLNIKNLDIWNNFDVDYVDYLCVNHKNRQNNIASEIIATSIYNKYSLNSNIKIRIFKKVEGLRGIIPFCDYYIFGFLIKNSLNYILKNYNINKIDEYNIDNCLNFIEENKDFFNICIKTKKSTLLELIKTNNISLYYLYDSLENKILAIYFIRKSLYFVHTKNIDIPKKSYYCFSSICNTTDIIFQNGFKKILNIILQENKDIFFLNIENISHNYKLLNYFKEINILEEYNFQCSYFFHNYICKKYNNKEVLVIL